MALRKNQPQTRWVVAQRRQPSSVSNVWPSFIAISAWGGSSCEKTSCTKTAYCISNDMLTQLALLTVVNNELGKPNAWVLTNLCSAVQDCIDQEFIQDLIGDTIQWFDYNDALNQWLLENPFPIPYTLTSSWNSITLTIAWNPAQTATLVLSNSLTNTGLVITSSVNWVVSNTDITSAVQSLIDANTDSVTNTVAGHLIATHTSVDNTVVNINETVTSLGTPTIAGNILTIPFNNENGVLQTVTVDLWGITPTNDINISTATYTAATNIITLTETNWDVYTIDLSEFSITTNTLPNGDVQIIQEGVVKATIPWAITILSYIPTCSWNVVSATNQVLTKDSLTTNVTVPTTVTTTPDPLTTPYTKAVKVNVGCNEDVYVPDTLWSLPVVAPVNQLCPVNQATTFVWQDYVRNNAWVLEVYSPRHRVITNAAFNPTAPTVWDLNATVTDWCGFTWEVDCQGNVVFTWGQKQYRQMDVWNSADDTFPFAWTNTSWNWFDLYRSVFSLSVNMCVPVLPLWYRAYFSWNIVESWFSIEFANTAWVLRHITGLGFDSWYIDRTIDMTSSWMDIRNNIERIPLVISWWLVNWTNNFQVFMEYRVDNWIAPFNTWWSMYWYVYWFDWILSIVRS